MGTFARCGPNSNLLRPQLAMFHPARVFTCLSKPSKAASSPIMAFSQARLLLRLPASLRQSILVERSSESTLTSRCSFKTSFFRTFASSKAPPPIPPKPLRKPSVPGTSPALKSQPATARPIPQGSSAPPTATKLDGIAPGLERVILYAAPRHDSSFFGLSYFTGAVLILGASETAKIYLKDKPDGPTLPWWVKGPGMLTALFLALMGTTCILAPTKLIKTIAIVTKNGERTLRFEMKKALWFTKPQVLDTRASEVAMNRHVPMSSPDTMIKNIKLWDAKGFTEGHFAHAQRPPQRRGVLSSLSDFNKSLPYAWPALKRDVKRMMWRDQMAYVRIEGHGNFKLDLQGCTLLNHGRPLEKIIDIDVTSRPSVTSWFKRMTSS